MASTYVNDLRLNELGTGDGSGTWGTTTNTNLELIAEGLSFGTEGITTNADTHTSTIADGATDPVRSMFVKYTGTLDSACTITIAPNTISRVHFIENGTSGSQNIIIKQGSGAEITIPPGDVKCVYLDGAGSGAAVVDAFASLSVVDLKVQDDLTVTDDASVGGLLKVTGDADADDRTGDSATGRLTIGAGEDLNLYHGGTNSYIVNDTGDLFVDTAGDLYLDAAGSQIAVQNDGSNVFVLQLDSTPEIDVVGNFTIDGTGTIELDATGDITLDASADIVLDAAGGNIEFKDAATTQLTLDMDGTAGAQVLQLRVNGDDLVFKQYDGTEVMKITDEVVVEVSNDITVAGRASSHVTTDNDGSFDLAVGNDFKCTPSGNFTLTFTNAAAGQSGNIILINSGGHTVSAHADVAINADTLTALTTAGTYALAYYCSAASGNNTITVAATGALT
jgi:hypothetical protein